MEGERQAQRGVAVDACGDELGPVGADEAAFACASTSGCVAFATICVAPATQPSVAEVIDDWYARR